MKEPRSPAVDDVVAQPTVASPTLGTPGFQLRGVIAGTEVVFPLADGLLRLGRDASNDLVLDQEGVSRFHAVLLVDPDCAELIDAGSKNGVEVNGRRVDRARLPMGARVTIGSIVLNLEGLEPGAVSVWDWPADATSAPASSSSSTAVAGATDLATEWVELAAELHHTVAHDSAESLASVPGLLVARLPVSAAALWRAVNGHVALVAGSGEVTPAAWNWATTEVAKGETASFQHRGAWTLLARRDAGGDMWGWLLLGDFAGRPRSQSLLTLLLDLARPTKSAPTARPARNGIVFPTGYVPGRAPAMQRLHRLLAAVAGSDLPVLIVGESGVGKELTARMVHDSSGRKGAFAALNCAAIPDALFEAELFGIGERVATGVAGRMGRIRTAEGGTLFLDEIGEMRADLQAKLLRVLETRRIEPLGQAPADVDVRWIAATNADLSSKVAAGSFRRDLYYRLAGTVAEVPPLRQRRDDLAQLAGHFLHQACARAGRPLRGLSGDALAVLRAHDWPGNVRELEHCMAQIAWRAPRHSIVGPGLVAEVLVAGATVGAGGEHRASTADVEEMVDTQETVVTRGADHDDEAFDLDLARIERATIGAALTRTRGNQVQAAELLGISRYQLRRRLKGYGPASS